MIKIKQLLYFIFDADILMFLKDQSDNLSLKLFRNAN